MQPPFCPNKGCTHHQEGDADRSWYIRDGAYRTQAHGRIQRYRCSSCGKQFSEQTFRLDYAVKKKLSYRYIFNQLKSGAGIRSIARDLKVTHPLILNRCSRLARSALAMDACLKSTIRLHEDLVADGFESFVISQYFPNNIHLLAGKASQYIYGMDYAHLRRKGQMTEGQKLRRKDLDERFISGRRSITESFRALIDQFEHVRQTRDGNHTILYTDEKMQYHHVFEAHRKSSDDPQGLSHIQISSRKARTVRNRLFAVNYLDREIRKDCANHVRETVQFSRKVSHLMERLAIYRVYHNYRKPYRVDHPVLKKLTHGERAGIQRNVIQEELRLFFTRRRFLSRLQLCWSDVLIWLCGLATPCSQSAQRVPHYVWA